MENRPEKLGDATPQSKWYAADMFDSDREYAFIKSFIHRDYAIGMHSHDFWELNIVLQGDGVHYLADNVFDIRQGDVFAIPPNVGHGYFNIRGLDVYHMLIRRDFFTKYMAEIHRWAGYIYLFQVEPFLRNVTDKSIFLHLSSDDLKRLCEDIQHIETYKSSDSSVKEFLINSVAVKMLYHLCFCMAQQIEIDSNGNPNDSYAIVHQCLSYIHRNFNQKITVQSLSDLCHVSRATLFRCFSSVCKCSPGQYITKYRLERASDLLSGTGKSLTEVAAECGFYDYSHLKRMIRTGCSNITD